jgi:hypothetical protein
MDGQSVKEIAKAFFIALFLISVFVGVWWRFLSRTEAVLRVWAAENRFEILSFQKSYTFGTGPFKWWTNTRNQVVYQTRVRDTTGKERSAWVRCNAWSKLTEVIWDDK